MCLFVPYMSINGLKSTAAMSESIGRFGKNEQKNCFFSFITSFELYNIGSTGWFSKYRFVGIIVDSILYTFKCLCASSLFVAYYHIEGLDRNDYTKEYYYKNTKDKL